MASRKKAVFVVLVLNIITFFIMILWLRYNERIKSKQHSEAEEISLRMFQKAKEKMEYQRLYKDKRLIRNVKSINPSEKDKPTLVVFTTFKAYSPHHTMAHRLVILNWASFPGVIKPVLFANISDVDLSEVNADNILIANAIENGWDVLPIRSANIYGTPHLKPMYEDIFNHYNATFYGYANGDLLFNDDMIRSLQFLKAVLSDRLSNNALLVGRRTDIHLRLNENSSLAIDSKNDSNSNYFLQDIGDYAEHFNKSNLPELLKKGLLRGIFAIDYFFFTRDNSTFNWSAIADVVIGRRAYDQYLIAMAIRFKVNSVDLSRVVATAHLSRAGVPDTSYAHKDSTYNLDLIGGGFPYNDGLTSTTFYYIAENTTSDSLILVRRPSK